jgi:hypothetical protein
VQNINFYNVSKTPLFETKCTVLDNEIMTVKLLILIFALTFLTVAGTAQDNYRPKKKDLSWSIKADGLRMTAWTNPATDKVFVAIRNFSTKKICYCDPQVNNFTVYARKNAASQWQEITLKPPLQEIVVVAICNAINFEPNEEMPSYVLQNGVRKKKNYYFSLDLREYSFPADLRDRLKLRLFNIMFIAINPKTKLAK